MVLTIANHTLDFWPWLRRGDSITLKSMVKDWPFNFFGCCTGLYLLAHRFTWAQKLANYSKKITATSRQLVQKRNGLNLSWTMSSSVNHSPSISQTSSVILSLMDLQRLTKRSCRGHPCWKPKHLIRFLFIHWLLDIVVFLSHSQSTKYDSTNLLILLLGFRFDWTTPENNQVRSECIV